MVEVLGAGVSLHKLMLILGQVIVNRLDGAALDTRDLRFARLARNWELVSQDRTHRPHSCFR